MRTLRGEVRGGTIEPIELDEMVDEMAASLLVSPLRNSPTTPTATPRFARWRLERYQARSLPGFARPRKNIFLENIMLSTH